MQETAAGVGANEEAPFIAFDPGEEWVERQAVKENEHVLRNPMPLPPGSWVTPLQDREGLAPGTGIQRRVPQRTFQVFIRFFDPPYSKTFKWSDDPTHADSMEAVWHQAVQWSWDEWDRHRNN